MMGAEKYSETYAEAEDAPLGGFMTLDGVAVPTPFACAWAPGYESKAWPPRSGGLLGIVAHETAGPSAGSAFNAWRAGQVGAEFVLDVDGKIWQCADPVTRAPWHAGPWSRRHAGIEVVCPVTDRSPYSKPPGGAWPEPWASAERVDTGPSTPYAGITAALGRGIYVPPFPVQLGAFVELVDFLKANVDGLEDCEPIDAMAWKLVDATPRAGIVAHGQISADRTDGYGPLRALVGASV